MTANKHILKLAVGSALLSTMPTHVYAHGWSEYPSARQNICYEQGGIWSGSPPMPLVQMPKAFRGLTHSYSATSTPKTLLTLTTRAQ